MSTKPADWVEPGDPVDPKLPANRTVVFIVGLLALAGAALAFYFLLVQGGLLLVIGFMFELLSLLEPQPGGQDGFGSMLMLPAIMVVSGLCLAFGLLDIAFRGIARKPFPSRSSFIRFCLISLTLVGSTALAVGILTRTVAG